MISPIHDFLRRQAKSSGPKELIFLTSVLGVSASWLVQTAISEILNCGEAVVLVSLTHNLTFHQDCLRRLGTDLAIYSKQGSFAFIDGLSSLSAAQASKGPPDAIRGLSSEIISVIKRFRGQGGETKQPVLLLENVDLLQAATEASALDMITEMLEWHELVAATFVSVNADLAFMQHPRTRLELEHSFLVSILAHEASFVLGLRQLDTGVARDISGVLRITETEKNIVQGTKCGREDGDKEMLYFVGDGAVEVFHRGQLRGL